MDEANGNGADIQAGEYGSDYQPACSDTYKEGQIIKYACMYGTSDLANGCGRPLTTHSRITYQIANGKACTSTPSTYIILKPATDLASLDALVSFRNSNSLTFEITKQSDAAKANTVVLKIDGVDHYVDDPNSEILITSSSTLSATYYTN